MLDFFWDMLSHPISTQLKVLMLMLDFIWTTLYATAFQIYIAIGLLLALGGNWAYEREHKNKWPFRAFMLILALWPPFVVYVLAEIWLGRRGNKK